MIPEQEDFLSFDFDAFEGMDIDVNIDVEEESEEFQNELLHARLATVKKNHVLYDNAEKLAKVKVRRNAMASARTSKRLRGSMRKNSTGSKRRGKAGNELGEYMPF